MDELKNGRLNANNQGGATGSVPAPPPIGTGRPSTLLFNIIHTNTQATMNRFETGRFMGLNINTTDDYSSAKEALMCVLNYITHLQQCALRITIEAEKTLLTQYVYTNAQSILINGCLVGRRLDEATRQVSKVEDQIKFLEATIPKNGRW